jgi:hypothetical protein
MDDRTPIHEQGFWQIVRLIAGVIIVMFGLFVLLLLVLLSGDDGLGGPDVGEIVFCLVAGFGSFVVGFSLIFWFELRRAFKRRGGQ